MRVKKILIVDDDPFACDILRKYLEGKGFRADFVYKSEMALGAYKKERPDVVLLDIRMPGRHGMDILKDIRGFDHNARVIMVSAVLEEWVVDQAKLDGALDYIKKPIDTHKLERLLVAIDHSIW